MSMIDKYPKITEASLEIAYDNGVINAGWTEKEALERISDALCEKYTEEQMTTVETHLATLSKEQLVNLCTGEETTYVGDTEIFVNEFLNFIFEHM